MSPRRTQALHQVGHGQHLGTILLVDFQPCHLAGQGFAVSKPSGGVDQCASDRCGSAHARVTSMVRLLSPVLAGGTGHTTLPTSTTPGGLKPRAATANYLG